MACIKTIIFTCHGQPLTGGRKIRTDDQGEYVLHMGMKARLKDMKTLEYGEHRIYQKQIIYYQDK